MAVASLASPVAVRFAAARQSLAALRAQAGATATQTARPQVSFVARYEDRASYAIRSVYEARDTYASREVYEQRDVTEQREVYETRPVYAYEPVYTDRAVYETSVTGTRALTGFATSHAASLDDGADFSVSIGGGAASTVKFVNATTVSVTTGGVTHQFSAAAADGGFKVGLANALNSISGLEASYDANGKLVFKTSAAQSLTLAEVSNELLDLSGTALDKLGLSAGTTQAHIARYEQDQTGTRQVHTGDEQVRTGSETVIVGSEDVKVGDETYVSGSEQVATGSESYADGVRSMLVGYDRTETAGTNAQASARATLSASRTSLAKLSSTLRASLQGSGAIGTRITAEIGQIYADLGSGRIADDPRAIDATLKRLQRVHTAYFAASQLIAATSDTAGFSV